MRILFITETFPYPQDSGGRVRTFHTLRMLGPEHEVHLHALTRRPVLADHVRCVEPHCASVTVHPQPIGSFAEIRGGLASLMSGRPHTVMRHVHERVADRLKRARETVGPDLIYCDHLSTFEYGRRLGCPTLIDAHNVECRLFERQAALTPRWAARRAFFEREWRALRRYEREAYAEADLVLTVSDVDAEAIRMLTGGRAQVRTVPIALDVEATQPIGRLTSAPEMLFLGGLHWPANADAVAEFAGEMLPAIRRHVPDARLTVVGRDEGTVATRLRRLAGVRLAGVVDDIAPSIHQSRVLVVPLRAGSGTRVKILDAFAHALPVVSTTLGCEGLPVVPGRHLLVADEAGAFVHEVVRILKDDGLAMSLAQEGRRLVHECHAVAMVAPRLLEAVSRVRGVVRGSGGRWDGA